jgi:hypothetical protein
MSVILSNVSTGCTQTTDLFPHGTAATQLAIDALVPTTFTGPVIDASYYRGANFQLMVENHSDDLGSTGRTFNCKIDHSPDGNMWALLHTGATPTYSFTQVAAGATFSQMITEPNVGKFIRVTVVLSGALDGTGHIVATVGMAAKK